ncbi:MAG: zinc ribbon domain-containing protein [Deltaproteobacteria bacterium]|nr:zinc ribbon domain-containing protein [Deltaproteobacteria bacterium]
MPIYEYQCGKCNKVTERLQGINAPPLRKCPSCGGRVEKMMSPGAFVLKGSGWYATDYANKGNGKGAGKAPSCPASGGEAAPACAGCPKAD